MYSDTNMVFIKHVHHQQRHPNMEATGRSIQLCKRLRAWMRLESTQPLAAEGLTGPLCQEELSIADHEDVTKRCLLQGCHIGRRTTMELGRPAECQMFLLMSVEQETEPATSMSDIICQDLQFVTSLESVSDLFRDGL